MEVGISRSLGQTGADILLGNSTNLLHKAELPNSRAGQTLNEVETITKLSLLAGLTFVPGDLMTDQQLALQAMSDAKRILEEYLEPKPHNNERLLDRLVEVFERPDIVVAVDRLRRSSSR
jgi:hypothetical protein